jgi:hypothetical protein
MDCFAGAASRFKKPFAIAFSLLLLQPGLFAAVTQESPLVTQSGPSPEITFHSSSNLVLVDVFARNLKNGLPDNSLGRNDFQVFDNGHPVSIKTFDSGTATRPVALWFVVQCNMQGWQTEGSGLFAGKISLLKPALKNVANQDTVAVAHWCDNGDSKLDLKPTSNTDAAATALEQVLTLRSDASPTDRPGELALQHTLQLIINTTHTHPDTSRASESDPLPVVIFLYGDHSGMPRAEADHFINELLETSAIAFGLKDRRSPGIWFLPGEQKEVAHYIANQTGGQYLRVTPETYATGLEEILRQLHFRYELGFKPEALDGKRHALRVEFTDAVKSQHKRVRLRYRAAYVPIRDGIR